MAFSGANGSEARQPKRVSEKNGKVENEVANEVESKNDARKHCEENGNVREDVLPHEDQGDDPKKKITMRMLKR